MIHPDQLSRIVQDRQQDRLAAAAEHRLAPTRPARARVAHSLRRMADRLDAATVSPAPPVRSVLPGGG